MRHRAHAKFWKSYRALPQDIRLLADRSYAVLCKNPDHPSLHFKKVGAFWSSRVGLHYRALAIEAEQDLVWFWIGSHADYDKLVGRKSAKPPQPTSHARRKAKPKRRSRPTRR